MGTLFESSIFFQQVNGNYQMLKAVIFDLDDTLIDWSNCIQKWPDYTYPHFENAFSLLQTRSPMLDRGTFFRTLFELREQMWSDAMHTLHAPHVGKLLTTTLDALKLPAHLIDETTLLHAYDWQPVAGEEAFPEARAVLKKLTSCNVKMGIVSNASEPMWMRDRELQAFQLLEFFPECRVSSADVGYLKPHPAIFKAALERLNVSPEEVVFVGDNPFTDILGAHQVGMCTVLRVSEQAAVHEEKRNWSVIPDGIITTLYELPPLLERWFP
ncbi:MAG: HAD family hydrolase [Chloroflexota bacterium]|nr:HAD family hydrolase [Chloroflexota bacterium]MDQ5865023.1 HAD family hydrolase [Chloroflexota bacterium]